MTSGLRSTTILAAAIYLTAMPMAASVLAQPAAPPAPTDLIDPTVSALRATVEGQQLEFDRLKQESELGQRELRLTRAEVNLDLDRRLSTIRMVGIAVVVIGIGSLAALVAALQKAIRQAADTVEARVTRQFNERIDRIDPSAVQVHVPAARADIRELLTRSGFSDIQTYGRLTGSCLEGVVVVALPDVPALESPEIQDFLGFLRKYQPKPDQVGFLLVTPGVVPKEVLGEFSNLTYANSQVTISNNTFILARMLRRRALSPRDVGH